MSAATGPIRPEPRPEHMLPGSRADAAGRAMQERLKRERKQDSKKMCRNCGKWKPGNPVGRCSNGYTANPTDKCPRWAPREGGGQ